MGLTVYGSKISQPSRSVFLFCTVAKIPYTEKIVNLPEGEHKKEAYKSINARCAVPAIVEDDFKLSECMTILKYLAGKYKAADHWYPADLKVRARVDELLDWLHTGLRPVGIDVFFDMIFTPMMSGKPIDEVKLAKDLERFDSTLTLIEKTFLGDKDFLASKEISIADICTLSEMMQVFAVQRTDLLANHPKLKAWKDRVQKQLNPAFDEIHKTLLEFTASTLKK